MHVVFALPPSQDTAGGIGLVYAERMAAALIGAGHVATIQEGADPQLPPGAVPVIDGLLLPRLLPRLDTLASQGAVALMHHVAARVSGDGPSREVIAGSLRQMLPRMRRVISTSHPVAHALMTDFGVDSARSIVINPGLEPYERSQLAAGPCRILSTGVLTKRKGHDTLLLALARLMDLEWTLSIAGQPERDAAHAEHLDAMVQDLGLQDRVTIARDVDPAAMEQQWRDAGLFALLSRWEGYPAGVAQALRRGVPVVVSPPGSGGVVPDGGWCCLPAR